MDREVQNFDCQEAILKISKNGEYLSILNSKLVDTVFHHGSSADKLKEQDNTQINSHDKNEMKNDHKDLYSDSEDFGDDSNDELDQETQNEIKLVVQPSSASCYMSDIKVITFGGFSSRFWSLRKHIISTEFQFHKAMTLPFYSWQCISLSLGNRDVDIVIKNERVQNNLVKYLLCKLETIEGKAGSASKLIQAMNKE